jgi:Ca2+-transporting ATPase
MNDSNLSKSNVPDRLNDAHALDVTEIARTLNVDFSSGLNTSEVEIRRSRFGSNSLPSIRPPSVVRMFFRQFASLVILLLAGAALIALVRGDRLDAIAIFVVLTLNSLIGFATEWQANRAMSALRREVRTTARVRREGNESQMDATDLVPGDVIILNAGDRVPADCRIFEASNLRTQESSLTGESGLVDKSQTPVARETTLAERSSMLYLGTTVVAGHGRALVVSTGAQTELGRIGRLVETAVEESTPLEKRLAELGRRLVYIVLGVAMVVTIAGWLRGDPLWQMFEVGISLAVAAVPEGLPMVTTLILAFGVLLMAKQRAIVRRLSAVETLGSTTVICSDKTGTLTENRMTAREFFLSDGLSIEIDPSTTTPVDGELLHRAALAGILCNEAAISISDEGGRTSTGDPTETALLEVAHDIGIDVQKERTRNPKCAERPFDSSTKTMTTVHCPLGVGDLFVKKGAPAEVLRACTRFALSANETRDLDADTRAKFISANNEMASRALRVLALAEKRTGRGNSAGSYDAEMEGDFTFLGLVGLIDPPRKEVAEAIRRAHEAGIRTVMLTGDQINTARAIANELGLRADGHDAIAIHARDLESYNHESIAKAAKEADVFARVSPEDKLRIVEALQRAGEIVAVTGDGVNDAPALKQADIGIAMGQRGTEVAKEAADIVLADDNFATIVRAIEGGRTIYQNIIKFVHLMFSKNFGEVLVLLGAIVAGWPLPLMPLQILWLNLVTDVLPGLALAVEPAAPGVMRFRPRSPKAALLSRTFLVLIGWQGAMLAAITLFCYAWALAVYGEGEHARTVALLSLVGGQVGHMFNCRSQVQSAIVGLFRNPHLWFAAATVAGLQAMAVYFHPLSRILGTVEPTGHDWLMTGVSVLLPIVIVEVTKHVSTAGGTD